FADEYVNKFSATPQDVETALAYIAYSMDIPEAAGNAHLIIEALPEDLAVKKTFYNELKITAPKNAIFASTSAGLDPGELSKASGRANKFVNFHFSQESGPTGTLIIISLPATDPE
ncbi:3-hydroxyacyl-CoA dehydrogenase NAD-binding domain-containing protein, partial [Salinimicrobium oceani]